MAKLSKAALALEIVRIPPNGLQPFADLQKAAIRVLLRELGEPPGDGSPVWVGPLPSGSGGIPPSWTITTTRHSGKPA